MRPLVLALLVAVSAAASLAAQQEQRVVRGLSFEGNRAIDDYTLRAAIATSNSSWFARVPLIRHLGLGEKRVFDELEFRRDVVRLMLLYRQSGFMSAVVDTVVRRTGRDVYIAFRIYEGEPVRLDTLEVLGLESILDVQELKRTLPIREGDPFNRLLFQAAADTIVTRLRNRGYPFAEIFRSFDVDAAALNASAALEAVPGPRMRVGQVVITGTRQVDTGTVRKMLSVKQYDQFRQDRLYQTQRDLYGLGMFRTVNVVLADSVPPPTGDSTVRIHVRVSEAPLRRIRIGAGYATLDCFRFQAGWTGYDFLGGARALDLTGRVSKLGIGDPTNAGFGESVCRFLRSDQTSETVNYSVGLTLRQPVFLSPRHTASLGVFAERRSEFAAYTRQAVGVNAAVTFNARRDVPVTLGYGYSVGRTSADAGVYCSVFRVCDEADRNLLASDHPFGVVTVSGIRDRTNSVLDPSAGSLVTAALAHSSRLVGSDTLYEFNRGQLEVSRYHPIGRRGVFAWRVRGGVILPGRRIAAAGQSVRFVPPDQRFYGGGPNSVRGYKRNELGPRVYVTDTLVIQGADTTLEPGRVGASPTGGNSLFVANAELRFATPLFPERMRVALFVDAGQVWERGDQLTTVSGLRVTPGAGVRFATPLGPVRLDAAYNGYPAERGPVYFQDNNDLTLIENVSFEPGLPPGFWRRVVVQFSVGQAF
ncbi:MAG TPA: BamA/TamA family outer membrane protein [Gemmatimonadales bacterium]|nr:BamA/TamA family outer membrane protein [Gemmatimonadales bacterium]